MKIKLIIQKRKKNQIQIQIQKASQSGKLNLIMFNKKKILIKRLTQMKIMLLNTINKQKLKMKIHKYIHKPY